MHMSTKEPCCVGPVCAASIGEWHREPCENKLERESMNVQVPTKDWAGQIVKCDNCGSTTTEYVKDVEHDGGDCEVFKCLDCGRSIHRDLPD